MAQTFNAPIPFSNEGKNLFKCNLLGLTLNAPSKKDLCALFMTFIESLEEAPKVSIVSVNGLTRVVTTVGPYTEVRGPIEGSSETRPYELTRLSHNAVVKHVTLNLWVQTTDRCVRGEYPNGFPEDLREAWDMRLDNLELAA